MATGAPAECEAIRAAIYGGRRHGAGTVEFYPTWFEGDAPWIVTSPEQSETLRLLETRFAPIEHGGLAHVGIGVDARSRMKDVPHAHGARRFLRPKWLTYPPFRSVDMSSAQFSS
jgi:hypothetical protein